MVADTTDRRYELDWLRVLAILVVFVYHSTRFFNLADWHVKNVVTYLWVEIWIVYASQWLMPLFFVISGAGLHYAMDRSGGWTRFYKNKFLRLMIPVLVASVTHSALQVYLERVSHGLFSGSFMAFLPEYFNGIYLAINMPGIFAWHGMHLWYLFFLFVYSLICYPLFRWLKGGGDKILNRVASAGAVPGLMVFCFSMPLILMRAAIPQDVLRVGSGGWGFLYYLWFLMAGFTIVSSRRLQERIKNHSGLSLAAAVVLTAAYLMLMFSPPRVDVPARFGDWIMDLLLFFSTWNWLFAILGFGMRRLAFDRPFLRQANEGVLPFYILHQTVLLAVGYSVMTWPIHDVLKWALTFAGSFMIIMAFYTTLIRKMDPLRFLFGMKTTRPVLAVFQKKRVLIPLHALFVGLIVFAAANQMAGLSPMPMNYDAGTDVVLDSDAITDRSPGGVRIVNDAGTSKGKAIEFVSGAKQQIDAQPDVYVDLRFSAEAGRYTIWLRGKCDLNSNYADSVWLQVDDQIGTGQQGLKMGNWLDVHPAGAYAWAGDASHPVAIELKTTGDHVIRIQPRQTPHRIDQVWLSRLQPRIPNTSGPVR